MHLRINRSNYPNFLKFSCFNLMHPKKKRSQTCAAAISTVNSTMPAEESTSIKARIKNNIWISKWPGAVTAPSPDVHPRLSESIYERLSPVMRVGLQHKVRTLFHGGPARGGRRGGGGGLLASFLSPSWSVSLLSFSLSLGCSWEIYSVRPGCMVSRFPIEWRGRTSPSARTP